MFALLKNDLDKDWLCQVVNYTLLAKFNPFSSLCLASHQLWAPWSINVGERFGGEKSGASSAEDCGVLHLWQGVWHQVHLHPRASVSGEVEGAERAAAQGAAEADTSQTSGAGGRQWRTADQVT